MSEPTDPMSAYYEDRERLVGLWTQAAARLKESEAENKRLRDLMAACVRQMKAAVDIGEKPSIKYPSGYFIALSEARAVLEGKE